MVLILDKLELFWKYYIKKQKKLNAIQKNWDRS